MMTTRMMSVATCNDAELVSASLSGNRDAFGHIVARYQSLVCSLAYSATGSLSQSEDLAQETFVAAWKQLAGLREPEKLRTWLCGIARNLIHNALRKQGREPSHQAESLDEISESYSPAEMNKAEEVIQRLSSLIHQQEAMPSQPQYAQTYVLLGGNIKKRASLIMPNKLGGSVWPNFRAMRRFKKINNP